METFTMSRKELPRPGLVRAALARQISNRQGANARPARDDPTVSAAQSTLPRGRGARVTAPRPRTALPAVGRARVARPRRGPHDRALCGLNDTHLTEKLREVHHLRLSRESVRRASRW